MSREPRRASPAAQAPLPTAPGGFAPRRFSFLSTLRSPLSTALVLVAIGATPLIGQWRTEPVLRSDAAPIEAVEPQTLRLPNALERAPVHHGGLLLAGLGGAAVGTLGGAVLGGALSGTYVGLGAGWFVGSALTTPLSVHLANGGQGLLVGAYLSSALIAGAGMAGAAALDSPGAGWIALAHPLVQAISAVLIEKESRR